MRKNNKSSSKKLHLETQTVRDLGAIDLVDVAGGNLVTKSPCTPSEGNSCTGCGHLPI